MNDKAMIQHYLEGVVPAGKSGWTMAEAVRVLRNRGPVAINETKTRVEVIFSEGYQVTAIGFDELGRDNVYNLCVFAVTTHEDIFILNDLKEAVRYIDRRGVTIVEDEDHIIQAA